MTNRIATAFARARGAGRPAFLAYLTAGDPSLADTEKLVVALADAGVDIVELGMPFSDPLIDGPTIQQGAQRALAAGATLTGVLNCAAAIRAARPDLPLVLYSYLNPLLQAGLDQVAARAAAAGIDGVLIVDLPAGLGAAQLAAFADHGVAPILLVAPTTAPARYAEIVSAAKGFIYVVALAGVTGVKAAQADQVAPILSGLRALTDLPLVVGVGIRTPEQVAAIGALADGVVVGSALVAEVAAHAGTPEMVPAVAGLARSLVAALPGR